MKKTFIPIGIGMLIALGVMLPDQSYAQTTKKSKSVTTEMKDTVVVNKKEEKNRNEMLNASSPSQPRQINTGIPPGGDVVIVENDLPVIFQFYPQIITSVWKYDANIGRIGLLSVAEGALTLGKVGFSVNTYDREAGNKFKGFFSAFVNSFGSLTYSGNVSGPIGTKGWGYVLGMHETYDRGVGGVNRMYSPYAGERMEMFKAGISKRYKQGSVKLLYKHAEETLDISHNQPLIYKGNGTFGEYPGFRLNYDSYTIGNGLIGAADANTGKSMAINLGDDKVNKTKTDAVYLMGEHNFSNGFKLKYSSVFQHSICPFQIQFPITLGITQGDATNNKFYLHGTTTEYTKDVQMVSNQFIEPTDITTSMTQIVLTKKIDTHSLRLGLTEQFYTTGLQKQDGGIYYQTVTPNPVILDWKKNVGSQTSPYFYQLTDANGILGLAGDESKTQINKTALYVSDDFSVGKIFDFTLGARLEKEDDHLLHNPYANDYIKDRPLMTVDFKNKFNHALIGSVVAKVTHEFGFLADVTYNDYLQTYFDYPADQKNALGNPVTDANGQPLKDANGFLVAKTTVAMSNQVKVMFLGGGIYWNANDKFSLVSKVSSSQKLGTVTNLGIINPANSAQTTKVYPLFYDIKTLGWTTDIVTSPFKNFNLHYLITIQNPQYKNYKASAWGNTYVYDNQVVPALSKVLMEIDPSYKLGDFRIWGSLRYFGKQYGNLTNSIYYKAWWENFAGVDYTLSRNCTMKLQVVNFLNQSGISGQLQGADQITKAQEPAYVGKPVNASGIRPRTIEFKVDFKI